MNPKRFQCCTRCYNFRNLSYLLNVNYQGLWLQNLLYLGFGRLNVLGFLMLELWFSLGHLWIFTKIQFFEARRFLLNSFYLAWQPLSSSCFGLPIRQSSHQDDASNKTENLNQYFKFDVPLLPSRALNLATFVFANFSFKLAGSYGVSPWLLKGRRSRLLVCIPSLPRSHLKIAYSAMLH